MGIGFETFPQQRGDRHGFKCIALDGYQDEMGSRNYFRFVLSENFEIQPHRLVADFANVNIDLKQIVKLCSAYKIAFEMCAREPNIKFIEHDTVGEASCTKQFSLGKFEETNICAVEDNACSVDIAPSNSFFYVKF